MFELDSSAAVRATYDAVAGAYDEELRDELAGKPLDRGLLDAFTELVGEGTIADVGCGPGHVTSYLAARHLDVVGVDLSPRMIAIAGEHAPALRFVVGSMLDLPVEAGEWAGIVAFYSIIHLPTGERVIALREFARALRPGGWLLIAFHVDDPDLSPGEVKHLTTWFGAEVDVDTHFLDPEDIARLVEASGFGVVATTIRQPSPGAEYPSRRCYLLARRHPST